MQVPATVSRTPDRDFPPFISIANSEIQNGTKTYYSVRAAASTAADLGKTKAGLVGFPEAARRRDDAAIGFQMRELRLGAAVRPVVASAAPAGAVLSTELGRRGGQRHQLCLRLVDVLEAKAGGEVEVVVPLPPPLDRVDHQRNQTLHDYGQNRVRLERVRRFGRSTIA